MQRRNRKIIDLVSDNPNTAAALHFLGIHFYNHTEETLVEVCYRQGLNPDLVIAKLNEVSQVSLQKNIESLVDYTPDVIIEFLKHNHFVFIKKRLPYLSDLMSKITPEDPEILHELQLVFPLFLEDFIGHIYEEEDLQFNYIMKLYQFDTKGLADESLYHNCESYSISKFQEEHSHETGLKGIRELTNNFFISSRASIHEKVILTAFHHFDKELDQHAMLENKVLYPKARLLENRVMKIIKKEPSLLGH